MKRKLNVTIYHTIDELNVPVDNLSTFFIKFNGSIHKIVTVKDSASVSEKRIIVSFQSGKNYNDRTRLTKEQIDATIAIIKSYKPDIIRIEMGGDGYEINRDVTDIFVGSYFILKNKTAEGYHRTNFLDKEEGT